MTHSDLLAQSFSRLRVLVVGDVMIDQYLTGRVDRISPEAPVPVVHLQGIDNRLGGAANVALNLRTLGAQPLLCSVLGNDKSGAQFLDIMPRFGLDTSGILLSDERATTVKTRVIAQNQHLLRIDQEDQHDLTPREYEAFHERLHGYLAQQPDLLIFQDYDKGVLTEPLIREVIAAARHKGIPVAVDPKRKNFWAYQGATLFKPNLKEVREALNLPIPSDKASLREAAQRIREVLHNDITLITLSEKGLYIDRQEEAHLVGTRPRSIADVCGAGDTVISVASLAVALDMNLPEIAQLSNLAGGQVCEIVGVAPVNLDQLLREYRGMSSLF